LYFYLKKEVEHLLVSPLLSPWTCLLEVEKRGREQHGGVKQTEVWIDEEKVERKSLV
jgi:hypothetical protein